MVDQRDSRGGQYALATHVPRVMRLANGDLVTVELAPGRPVPAAYETRGVVRALQPSERDHMTAFLAFCRAEPMPETPEGWLQREAEARRRWPTIADLFDGWGVDAAATARAAQQPATLLIGQCLDAEGDRRHRCDRRQQ